MVAKYTASFIKSLRSQYLLEHMPDKRQNLRSEMTLQIKVWGENLPKIILKTKNLSDSGIFLLSEDQAVLPLDTVLNVQVQGLPIDAPVKLMKVVRVGSEGFGLQHIE